MLGRYSERLIGQVCAHPHLALTAAGYNDGSLELISLAKTPRSQLPNQRAGQCYQWTRVVPAVETT